MSIFVKKFNGFIADAANIDFKRCDGTHYHCDTATATAMTPSANSISVTGGQSQYPIGFIDTDRGLEATFTNAMFDMDMFEVSNAGSAVSASTTTAEAKKYEIEKVNTGTAETPTYKYVATLPDSIVSTSIYIHGLEQLGSSETMAAGKYKVTYHAAVNASEGVTAKSAYTEVEFYSSDVANVEDVTICYERTITDAHVITVNTNTASAKGEVWMHWPVYSSGTDCTEAAVKGWVHVHIFRVRVTALPAIDSSYKTAA